MLSVSLLVLVGCSDPGVGTWESDEKAANGRRSEFTIADEGDKLLGEGTFQLPIGVAIVECSGDLVITVKRDREYDVEVQFRGANGCDMVPDVDADCTLEKDDTLLDCGSESGLWNRID
jgi:hypothetical protein